MLANLGILWHIWCWSIPWWEVHQRNGHACVGPDHGLSSAVQSVVVVPPCTATKGDPPVLPTQGHQHWRNMWNWWKEKSKNKFMLTQTNVRILYSTKTFLKKRFEYVASTDNSRDADRSVYCIFYHFFSLYLYFPKSDLNYHDVSDRN